MSEEIHGYAESLLRRKQIENEITEEAIRQLLTIET